VQVSTPHHADVDSTTHLRARTLPPAPRQQWTYAIHTRRKRGGEHTHTTVATAETQSPYDAAGAATCGARWREKRRAAHEDATGGSADAADDTPYLTMRATVAMDNIAGKRARGRKTRDNTWTESPPPTRNVRVFCRRAVPPTALSCHRRVASACRRVDGDYHYVEVRAPPSPPLPCGRWATAAVGGAGRRRAPPPAGPACALIALACCCDDDACRSSARAVVVVVVAARAARLVRVGRLTALTSRDTSRASPAL
jgi:hypothetical protein